MSQVFEESLSLRQGIATQALTTAVLRDRLANAYLLTGRGKSDKWLLARQLASFLNCSSRQDQAACYLQQTITPARELCCNCRWIQDNKHPQAFLTLSSEESSATGKIAVEKARLLSQELGKTSQYNRTIVIPDASEEIFHRPSANALLKTIEEPGPGCLFLLFAAQPEEVLPTIVSRCQVLPVVKSSNQLLWLEELDHKEIAEVETLSPGKLTSLSEALAWSRKLQEAAQHNIKPQAIIDIVIAKEVEQLASTAAKDPAVARYLKCLVELSEVSKQQIEHFVAAKYVLESLALSWHKLRVIIK